MYHTRRIPIRRARIANARKIHAKSTLPKQNSLHIARTARARSKTPTRQREAVARTTRCFVQTIARLKLAAWRARLASPRAGSVAIKPRASAADITKMALKKALVALCLGSAAAFNPRAKATARQLEARRDAVRRGMGSGHDPLKVRSRGQPSRHYVAPAPGDPRWRLV